MVWDPTGERLAVIIRGKCCLQPARCRLCLKIHLPAGRRGANPTEVRSRVEKAAPTPTVTPLFWRGVHPSSLPTSSWMNHLSQPPCKVFVFPQCPHSA